MSQKQLIMAIGNGGCKIVKSLETDLDKVFIDTDPEVIDKYDGVRIGSKTCGSYAAAGDIKLGQAVSRFNKIINEYKTLKKDILLHSAFGNTALKMRCYGKAFWFIYKIFEKTVGRLLKGTK